MQPADLLIEHAAELCTLAGPPGPRRGPAQSELGIIRDGAVAVGASGILAVGASDEVRAAVTLAPDARVIDASERTVIPGFVDPHTHAIFGGDRAEEFMLRLAGADYLEILKAGGGILNTVRATRAASDEALMRRTWDVFHAMLLHGTTTVEVKSGYGLSTTEELRLLSALDHLQDWHNPPMTFVTTLLAAHAVPPEYRDRPDAYVDLVCGETIPAAAGTPFLRFCDVFCETGVFSVEQSRRVLEAGRAHGLKPKLHAEQKSHLGGARLAAELRAASVDHLEYATDDDLRALAEASTVAVFLPGAAFMLREERIAPARRAIELGVPVALATDFNPGTCPILSMPVIIGLACLRLGLTPAQALVAATVNAAHAIGLAEHPQHRIGSLEPEQPANIVILDAPAHHYLPYCFGTNLVHTVIRNGAVAVENGRHTYVSSQGQPPKWPPGAWTVT